MRLSIALLCLFIANLVFAQESLNIKGAKIGMSVEEIRAVLGEPFECRDVYRDGTSVCGKPYDVIHPSRNSESYAGLSVYITRQFAEGKLIDIVIRGIVPDEFDELETALVNKFGAPDSNESAEVKNRMGANFLNVKARWTRGDSVLSIEKYCDVIDKSCLSLYSRDYFRTQAEARKAKAKADM